MCLSLFHPETHKTLKNESKKNLISIGILFRNADIITEEEAAKNVKIGLWGQKSGKQGIASFFIFIISLLILNNLNCQNWQYIKSRFSASCFFVFFLFVFCFLFFKSLLPSFIFCHLLSHSHCSCGLMRTFWGV